MFDGCASSYSRDGQKERGRTAEGLEVRALSSVLERKLTLWVTSSESLDSVYII